MSTNTVCPGSGQPTRTNGACDRCGRPDARGPYRATEVAENLHLHIKGERFAALPSMGYYEAVDHLPYSESEGGA